MQIPFFVLASLSVVLALPAEAQQGPAGVPGAPLIGATIAPAPPPPEPAPAKPLPPRKRAPIDCAKAKNIEQCKARQEARKQAREACQGKKATEHQQCLREKRPANQ